MFYSELEYAIIEAALRERAKPAGVGEKEDLQAQIDLIDFLAERAKHAPPQPHSEWQTDVPD